MMEYQWQMVIQNQIYHVISQHVGLMEELWWGETTQELILATAHFKWMSWHS